MVATPVEALRHLVRCDVCARQYDGSAQQPGDRFHCLCGELLTVPPRRSHEAAVVRCSACGGVRARDERRCGFCGAGFTLHERDLHTVCPGCLARISDRARFCHHCGIGIAVAGNAGAVTDLPCPACGEAEPLSSRVLDEPGFNALECNHCAGLWLDGDTFLALESRMAETGASDISGAWRELGKDLPRRHGGEHNFYRKCPECRVVMHRRNYGPGSGIVIDQCHQHGFWFDERELAVILRWIRTGGLLASHKRRSAMARDDERLARLLKEIETRRQRYRGGLREAGERKF